MTEREAGGAGDGDGPGTAIGRCYRHPDRETGVRCARCDRPICPQCMVPASVGFHCPDCVTEGRRTTRPARTIYGGRVSRGGVDATRVLVGINLVVFVITAAAGAGVASGSSRSTVYDNFALIPPAVASGEWYRLVSSMFLHFGILHVGFNMWALYVIGSPLEAMLGRLRFLTLYFLAGIGGSLLSFAYGPVSETAAGASGAIFGLFGGLYVLQRRRGLATGGIVGLIVINLIFSFTFANIDWRGHVGGLVVGSLVAAIFAWAPAGGRRDVVQVAGCVAVSLALVAFGFAGAARVRSECRISTNPVDVAACAHAHLPTVGLSLPRTPFGHAVPSDDVGAISRRNYA